MNFPCAISKESQNGNPRRWVAVLVSASGGQPEGGVLKNLSR